MIKFQVILNIASILSEPGRVWEAITLTQNTPLRYYYLNKIYIDALQEWSIMLLRINNISAF